MLSHFGFFECATEMYDELNRFSLDYPNLGRFFAVPIAATDVVLDVFSASEECLNVFSDLISTLASYIFFHLAQFFVSLQQFPQYKDIHNSFHSFDKCLFEAELLIRLVSSFPIVIAFAPLRFVTQLCAILNDPATVDPLYRNELQYK